MYNGIGLSTPRGSGTNGYVVRNLSFVKAPRPDRNLDRSVNDLKSPAPAIKQPNKDILLHDRKRKVEVKCMELRIKLEDDGVDTDTIESKVQELRESLMNNFEDIQPRDAKSLQEHETHQRSAAKEQENKKMMRALKIDSEEYVEGAAFDRELQEKKRLERIAKRQAQEEARAKNLEKRSRRYSRDRSVERSSRRSDRRHRSRHRRRSYSRSVSRSRSPSRDRYRSRRGREESPRSSSRRRHRSPSSSSASSYSSRSRSRSRSVSSSAGSVSSRSSSYSR
ncbi:hypothetical protein O0I10_003157 [Lichtheimia ornata]|uniref:CWF21 domain-containing protein n=1 Tax=Lichtheimia ornata TaxID=688661 RepID=A0AAD7Y028_9FUNG|nr:uncharacterized protein O0I10_003157 [Lichtheimia ornata]KAJ8660935.1 hypothetical protein O0I10_003157 [Lichtheimia ornata]